MEKYPHSEIAALNLLRNRQELGKKLGMEESLHTPPASHYPHIYLWDSCFAAIINARAGAQRWQHAAQTELLTLVEGQRDDGFIPNMQFVGNGRRSDPERVLAFGSSADGSNYTQPPVLALATAETYHSALEQNMEENDRFLGNIYPSLKNLYTYFENIRSNDARDKLIGVIHPHETGRDSDPTFDFIKPLRLKRNGPETHRLKDLVNAPIDYLSVISHGVKLRRAGGDNEKSRDIFWVNDVMMNCMYVDNLYQMAGLAGEVQRIQDTQHFSKLATTVENQILSDMWFPNEKDGRGAFYALNNDGNPIKEVSISNLFPLVLPNLAPHQLESLLDLMDSSFDTPSLCQV